MYKIYENFQSFLNEDIYSQEMRNFIRFSQKTEKIKDLRTRVKALHSYLADDWKRLGCGVFRCAYMSPRGEVIKIIRYDEEGLEDGPSQNKMEIERFNRADIEAFPRVEHSDPNHVWFVVEKVNPISSDGGTISDEIITKLFPKYMSFLSPIGIKGRMALVLLRRMLVFRAKRDPDETWWKQRDQMHGIMSAFRNEFDIQKMMGHQISQEQEKELFENIFNYMSAGDLNWRRLLRAVNDANVAPQDFHPGNLGYNDEGVIKIIDAGDIE